MFTAWDDSSGGRALSRDRPRAGMVKESSIIQVFQYPLEGGVSEGDIVCFYKAVCQSVEEEAHSTTKGVIDTYSTEEPSDIYLIKNRGKGFRVGHVYCRKKEKNEETKWAQSR